MTYMYKCTSCGYKHEVQHKISEELDIRCSCGAPMKRVPIQRDGGFVIEGFSEANGYSDE